MDGNTTTTRPYGDEARRVLALAAHRAHATRDAAAEPAVPVLVSAKNLLDAIEGGPVSQIDPVPPGTRLTPLVKQVLDEAGRVALARKAPDITVDDLRSAVTNVMTTWGIDPGRLSDVRRHAHSS